MSLASPHLDCHHAGLWGEQVMTSVRDDDTWVVDVYQTSLTDGRLVVRPDETPETSLHIAVGDSLLINFNRSIDLAHSLVDGVSGALPRDAKLDSASGFFTWQPRTAISQRLGLRFVAGARSVTFSIR